MDFSAELSEISMTSLTFLHYLHLTLLTTFILPILGFMPILQNVLEGELLCSAVSAFQVGDKSFLPTQPILRKKRNTVERKDWYQKD